MDTDKPGPKARDRGKQIVIYGGEGLISGLDRYALAYNMSRQQWVSEALRRVLVEWEPELRARESENARWGIG